MVVRGNYINGKWIQSKGNPCISINPSNHQIIWSCGSATQDNINEAVHAAHAAFPLWSSLPIQERANYIEKFASILKKNQDHLSHCISLETGKPLWESKMEVDSMIAKSAITIKSYQERCPETKISLHNHVSITRHRPHGVFAVLGPYNFPGHLPNGHIVPALLSGNTVIFKPSEHTPYVAQEIVAIWEEAGLPPGVMHLTCGGKDVGESLCEHPGIHGILFTGSWATGSMLTKKYATSPRKILALEMGGNNPIILGNTTNLKSAAYLTLISSYITAGQRCSCARRIIIPQSKQGDEFLDILIRMISKLTIGSPSDHPEPFMGPLISREAAYALLQAQQNLFQLGGKSLVTMQELNKNPNFLSPGLIDVSNINQLPDEEYFGPLLQVMRVKDFDTAILKANDTEYGLTASLLSDDRNEYETFLKEIQAGIINWNMPTIGASSAAPFGGRGKSGNNRPSAFYAVDYTTYPIASLETASLQQNPNFFPGLKSIEEGF